MKQRFSRKMIIGEHHRVIQNALDRTMLPPNHPDFISRLIITVPPGYTKTELASINYMARGLAIDNSARFLHLSYSHTLALQNSATTREIVKSSTFQEMWPTKTKDDTDSKSLWWTNTGGGVYATSAAGQVTGFRAGHMDSDKFSGALIIDDPVKPDDAYYENKREAINTRFNETIASRLAVEHVPIIVIMQRIHYRDLVGYLLMGGSGEKWHHLNLPVYIDDKEDYPEEYTHGILMDHGLPNGWLWPFKHNDSHLVALKAHRRRYKAQYKQAPPKRDNETELWTDDMIKLCKKDPFDSVERTLVAVDPAVSNNVKSDEHGIVVGSSHGKDRYLIEADWTCKGPPTAWANKAIMAYDYFNADAIVIEVNQGGDMCEETLRNAGFKGRVIRVHASKGKVIRAEPIAALYDLGMVKHLPGLEKLEDQLVDFDPVTGLVDGKSPNRLDAAVWVLTELSGKGMCLNRLLKLVVGGN